MRIQTEAFGDSANATEKLATSGFMNYRGRFLMSTRTPGPGFAGLRPGKQARRRVVVYCQRLSPRFFKAVERP